MKANFKNTAKIMGTGLVGLALVFALFEVISLWAPVEPAYAAGLSRCHQLAIVSVCANRNKKCMDDFCERYNFLKLTMEKDKDILKKIKEQILEEIKTRINVPHQYCLSSNSSGYFFRERCRSSSSLLP